MRNLAHDYIRSLGLTLAQARKEWSGCCVDFVGDLLEWVGRGDLAYWDLPQHPIWRYHATALLDGMIHDLWLDRAISLRRAQRRFGERAEINPGQENHACQAAAKRRKRKLWTGKTRA